MDLLDASPQQHAPPAYQVRLDALRKAAQRIDPVRMHYLDVLSQRIATALKPYSACWRTSSTLH